MRPSHFIECLSKRNHCFGGEFGFRRGGKDEFQNLGDAKDRSIPGRARGIVGEENVGAGTAASVGFVIKSSVGVSTEVSERCLCLQLVGCRGLGYHDRYLGRGGRLRLRMMYSKCRRTWDVFVVSDIRGHCRCCRQGRGRLKVSAHLVPTRGGLLAFESQRNVSILSVCDGRRECRSFVQFWNACGWQWVLDWLGVLMEEYLPAPLDLGEGVQCWAGVRVKVRIGDGD